MPRRPQNEQELQQREAIGVIRASRFVRKYARSRKPISLQIICAIHREIFADAWPEIAGLYRQENLKITDSHHLPPHYSKVVEIMEETSQQLQARLKKLAKFEGIIRERDLKNDQFHEAVEEAVRIAAWIHHAITFVHPYLSEFLRKTTEFELPPPWPTTQKTTNPVVFVREQRL